MVWSAVAAVAAETTAVAAVDTATTPAVFSRNLLALARLLRCAEGDFRFFGTKEREFLSILTESVRNCCWLFVSKDRRAGKLPRFRVAYKSKSSFVGSRSILRFGLARPRGGFSNRGRFCGPQKTNVLSRQRLDSSFLGYSITSAIAASKL